MRFKVLTANMAMLVFWVVGRNMTVSRPEDGCGIFLRYFGICHVRAASDASGPTSTLNLDFT
jgi:hypothetical protein